MNPFGCGLHFNSKVAPVILEKKVAEKLHLQISGQGDAMSSLGRFMLLSPFDMFIPVAN